MTLVINFLVLVCLGRGEEEHILNEDILYCTFVLVHNFILSA